MRLNGIKSLVEKLKKESSVAEIASDNARSYGQISQKRLPTILGINQNHGKNKTNRRKGIS